MQQLLNVWTGLDLRRQIIVIAATVGMFLGIMAMTRMANAPSMTLLYAGLETGAAGDVVRSLEQRGVAFDVRGGAIFVDSRDRDQLRMTLASEGLPANGSRGYELLDSLSGFGTTSQMFDAAYWRAKEGEIARTIVSSPHVSMARVHIASTGSNPFQRGVTPKASVSITPNGAGLTGQQAKAIRFLVASAVAGLSPDDVSVIDANGTLLGAVDESGPAIAGDDKAQVMRERVERLLEARVGPGNAVVEVSVETVTETEEIRERRFDPDGRVAISTDTEETSRNANEAGAGGVTVASNLPDGDTGGEGESASSQTSETRERINYEVSETERAVTRGPGAIKRLSVAVLVNEPMGTTDAGEVTSTPRSEEEIQALRELVSSAVGYDESRGDIITIKSMPLQSIAPVGTMASTSLLDRFSLDIMSALQMAVLAVVTLMLGLFVVRPLLTRAPAPLPPPEAPPARLASDAGVGADRNGGLPALTGEIDSGDGDLPQMNNAFGDLPDLPAFNAELPSQDPVDRLRAMIGDRQEETVEILRTWLEEKEERA